jgi:hypothetical protein
VRGLRGDELLRRPVRLRGIELGRPVDLFLHPREPQALGLDVLCGDERHRFLPLSAAGVHEDHVEVTSPLVVLDRGWRIVELVLEGGEQVPLDGITLPARRSR